jgi:hypothetical protein
VGFSHAVFILLSINFGAIRRALAYERWVGRVKCFNWAEDRRTRLQLSQRQVAVYAHLDYVGGLASNRPLACQLPLNTSLKGSASVLGPAISMMEVQFGGLDRMLDMIHNDYVDIQHLNLDVVAMGAILVSVALSVCFHPDRRSHSAFRRSPACPLVGTGSSRGSARAWYASFHLRRCRREDCSHCARARRGRRCFQAVWGQ